MEDCPMPSPIPVPVRRTIFRRWRKGESVAAIAAELDLCERTVRHLVRRFGQRGEIALAPDRKQCPSRSVAVDVYDEAVHMRQQHPTWGAGLIRIVLRKERDTC